MCRTDKYGWLAFVCFCIAMLAGFLLVGCGGTNIVQPDGDPREQHVLDETARFAGMLRVKVHGVLTDDEYIVNCGDGTRCPAAGWYAGGVAYYWRPHLLKKDLAYGSALAAHETCHALHYDEKKADACAQELLLR